jgi:hypothetical protein
MAKDALQLLQEYGFAAFFLFVMGGLLIRYVTKLWPIWTQRDIERIQKLEFSLQQELASHQFFSNILYKINSEIQTLDFNSSKTPVRQKLFRKLIELRLQCMHDLAHKVITVEMENFSSSQWANFVLSATHQSDVVLEEKALKAGIPSIVIKKFLVWQHRTDEIFSSYVKDLAVSTVYGTNMARTNTLLYLMNLKMITTVGDAERTLIELNGDISGMLFNGEQIEHLAEQHQ